MDSPGVEDSATYDLAQRDAYVFVALRGRPRVGIVRSLFHELEQLTTEDAELLVLIDESEVMVGLLRPSELREMIDLLKASAGLRERSRIAIYAPSPMVYGMNRMAQAFAGQALEGRYECSGQPTTRKSGCLPTRGDLKGMARVAPSTRCGAMAGRAAPGSNWSHPPLPTS